MTPLFRFMFCVTVTVLSVCGHAEIVPEDPQDITCSLGSLLGIGNTSSINLFRASFDAVNSESEIPTEFATNQTRERTTLALEGKNSDITQSPSTNDAKLREKIRYLLFTPETRQEYQVMSETGEVTKTYWEPQRKTKVLIHGLTSTYWFSPIRNIWLQHIFDIKDAYLSNNSELLRGGQYNVVVMDWTSLSTVPMLLYPKAARATKYAGEDLSGFLGKLRSTNNLLSWDDVHLIGHSLGAHVAGIAGNKIQQNFNVGIRRITGLDPAGPCFDSATGEVPQDTAWALDKTDAQFVDVIHTNMGNVISSMAGRYGSVAAVGHADFYANGGEVQPDCNLMNDRINFCSHQKSVTYFATSVLRKLPACLCSDWESFKSKQCSCNGTTEQYFGELCDVTARGKYFVNI